MKGKWHASEKGIPCFDFSARSCYDEKKYRKDSQTMNDTEFLKRINDYAEQVMADIDPQKTPVSQQLEQLRPIMQEIADEEGASLDDIFIRYMDAASLFAMKRENEFQEIIKDLE